MFVLILFECSTRKILDQIEIVLLIAFESLNFDWKTKDTFEDTFFDPFLRGGDVPIVFCAKNVCRPVICTDRVQLNRSFFYLDGYSGYFLPEFLLHQISSETIFIEIVNLAYISGHRFVVMPSDISSLIVQPYTLLGQPAFVFGSVCRALDSFRPRPL